MSLSIAKRILLSIDEQYTIHLSSPIELHQNDSIQLIFEIINNNICESFNTTVAVLMIKNPEGETSVVSTEIKDNSIIFDLVLDETKYLGVSYMQIQLHDSSGHKLTLPPFKFTVEKNIYNGSIINAFMLYDFATNTVLGDENGNVICIEKYIKLE